MVLTLYNSLTGKKERFRPIQKKRAGLYTCGPTVYQYAHIGNLRTYIFEDVLKRVLLLNGLRVRHVMNVTDVGHLTSNADTGEDKIEREARKQRRSAWDIARLYEHAFKKDLERLNIIPPDLWARATEHVKEQIALVRTLEQKGFTYRTDDGIYFDTSKLKRYGPFQGQTTKGMRSGIRVKQGQKRQPTDFALWKFSPAGTKRQMEWPSPWGIGFPGWHLECSAISMKYLGAHFDIHTGGIDHPQIHHTNEIAQSESATGKKFVNYWLHGNFLRVEKTRMGKSEKNFVTLDELEKKGFDPLDFRYFALGAHYRAPLSFSSDALASARRARLRLYEHIRLARRVRAAVPASYIAQHKKAFLDAVNDDLNTPRALAAVRQYVDRSKGYSKAWDATLEWFDRVLGLALGGIRPEKAPDIIRGLVAEREALRKAKKWKEADRIRKTIAQQGWGVKDARTGPELTKIQ